MKLNEEKTVLCDHVYHLHLSLFLTVLESACYSDVDCSDFEQEVN